MKKMSFIKCKKFVKYPEKYLVLIKRLKCIWTISFKVRDHCHYTKKSRGAAHSSCNLRYKTPKKIWQYFIMVPNMIITS